MKQIRKQYVKPLLTVVGIHTENSLMAASGFVDSFTENISNEEGSGTDALGKSHGNFDLWSDDED